MKRVLLTSMLVGSLVALTACGDPSDSTAASESAHPSKPNSPNSSDTAEGAMSDAERAAEAAAQGTERGRFSLAVNGEEKTFSFFPAGKNMAMSMSTMILAKPAPDATEEFSIVVLSFDLTQAELPISLDLGLREAMESDNQGQFARSPKPMISYVSPEGVEYSSYATVVLERYENGILTGRVEDRELEPSDGDGSAVALSEVRFEVAL